MIFLLFGLIINLIENVEPFMLVRNKNREPNLAASAQQSVLGSEQAAG
jgi:hypothetical protein